MGHFLDPIQRADIVQRVDRGTQTAVETEYLVINQGGEGQVVEEICEVFPDIRVAVFPQTLVVESVDLGDLTRFVVAAEDGDALWVTDL